ncbi:MAG TPA: hypothetical protein VNC14_08290, partial [Lapillicoccus sp.]|nr:hypothetical protein [Lapillicoccus sp.]
RCRSGRRRWSNGVARARSRYPRAPRPCSEGVGSSRSSLAPWLDATVWVQSDAGEAYRRGIERDIVLGRDRAEAVAFWDEWMTQEGPFLAADRPWERADVVLCSTPEPAVPDGVVAFSRARAGRGAPAARTS